MQQDVLIKQPPHNGSFHRKKAWNYHSQVSPDFHIFHRNGICAPLFLLRIPLRRTKLQSDTALCNLRYSDVSQVPHTAEKLRYLRCQRNLYQFEVADYAGIDRSTYISYEDTNRDSYPLDKLAKIAELLQVPVTDLLDGYNLFLYQGQGEQIKAMRKRCRLTQAELGKLLQTSPGTVKRWEPGKANMSKRMWERMNEIQGCNCAANAV